jgi:antibiotic biosynthesis monooxygenase (ABM) superfamily enzyme
VIIYEVNLKVRESVRAVWLDWLRDHVAEMLDFPGFEDAEILAEDPAEPGWRRYCVRYRIAARADLERYLREDAERMRGEGMRRFPGQFEASRRVLSPLPRDA